MEVILLERVAKVGQMGEVVRVKAGFARNFLLKRGKALRATTDNRAKFEGMKADLEARNLEAKNEATKVAGKIDGRNVVILRQASEAGQLFGSVSVRDIIASFEAGKVSIGRSQVMLDAPIKTIGKHAIAIAVHPEVEVGVTVTVARSADEAERINRGEDISTRQEDQDAAAGAGVLSPSGDFGAGVTAGTGSARTGTSDFVPSPLGESSLAESDFSSSGFTSGLLASSLITLGLSSRETAPFAASPIGASGLAVSALGSSSFGLPRLLMRCFGESRRPSGPRSST